MDKNWQPVNKLPYSKRLLPEMKLATCENYLPRKRPLPWIKLAAGGKNTLLEKATARNETGNQ